ncbi:cyclic pyranopterin monophosphate synthase subunit MoaC [Arachidicoccus rhizosphaerae]|uniref:cyclic pyranopterin monophosphate synthase n=2 Tax=Arachidicoccus rhizosphaerae TaxID=551991 RepID=A0A1H3ZGE7_9BACT|nr:cyclic pyranopterin monophosphate synthase subunit MoaC [Arachidicoccus rhizosphaerae]
MIMAELSHINQNRQPVMVDVGAKSLTKRRAVARAVMVMPETVYDLLEKEDFKTGKGAVIQTAIIAGIMGAKKTGELIPLCHSLGMDNCQIDIQTIPSRQLIITCTASIEAKTGVEMEALTGASIAALTIYDMCKALSHDIIIQEIKLMEKTGGKSDFIREA